MRYLVVGAGLFGATCARELKDQGHSVLVLEKRPYPGGMAATEVRDGVTCQLRGGHIYHTNDKRLWDYVNRFATFRAYRHKVKARANDTVYSFPINLMTMQQMGWGVKTPAEGAARLAEEVARWQGAPGDDLETWAVRRVGLKLYETFVKGYTAKQWGRSPSNLPASIIKRIPVRLTWNDEYFDDEHQGLPVNGWTPLVCEMLRGLPVEYGVDYLARTTYWDLKAERVIYTGPLDALLGYQLGHLEYRSLRFEWETLPLADYQGTATVNYTDAAVPFTRIHEHKHWYPAQVERTVISREYPASAGEPYYPVDTPESRDLYRSYQAWTRSHKPHVAWGGRLADYQYRDMHQTIAAALHLVEKLSC